MARVASILKRLKNSGLVYDSKLYYLIDPTNENILLNITPDITSESSPLLELCKNATQILSRQKMHRLKTKRQAS